MNQTKAIFMQAQIVEEEIALTLAELCQACEVPEDLVLHWVLEGVVEPRGERPQDWRFTGPSLRRARAAWRLTRDLELNASGVCLVLDLLDEISVLRAMIERAK